LREWPFPFLCNFFFPHRETEPGEGNHQPSFLYPIHARYSAREARKIPSFWSVTASEQKKKQTSLFPNPFCYLPTKNDTGARTYHARSKARIADLRVLSLSFFSSSPFSRGASPTAANREGGAIIYQSPFPSAVIPQKITPQSEGRPRLALTLLFAG